MKDFTNAQKAALVVYLTVSAEHTKLQNEMPDNEYRPMTAVFAALDNLHKYFSQKEIDAIIINRDELIKIGLA